MALVTGILSGSTLQLRAEQRWSTNQGILIARSPARADEGEVDLQLPM